jgi:hypothetical protein
VKKITYLNVVSRLAIMKCYERFSVVVKSHESGKIFYIPYATKRRSWSELCETQHWDSQNNVLKNFFRRCIAAMEMFILEINLHFVLRCIAKSYTMDRKLHFFQSTLGLSSPLAIPVTTVVTIRNLHFLSKPKTMNLTVMCSGIGK